MMSTVGQVTDGAGMDAPRRPALRYHGAKWRLAPWILSHFPALASYDVYAEPFGGSAAVLLRKERSPIEVFNDLDDDVVGFFRALRECPEALIRAIELTPFARREWARAGEVTADPVENARRFYLRSYGSIAGPTAQWRSGWRRQKVLARRADGSGAMISAARTFADVSHLHTVAARMRGVFIEAEDALDLIRRYDHPRALFYVDPPYPAATRARWQKTAYRHEMSDEQHCQLAAVLAGCRGMVVLSGYDCELYRELFPASAWWSAARPSRTNGKGSANEVVWLNEAARAGVVARDEAARAARWPLLGEGSDAASS